MPSSRIRYLDPKTFKVLDPADFNIPLRQEPEKLKRNVDINNSQQLLAHFSQDTKDLQRCSGYVRIALSYEYENTIACMVLPCGCWECGKCGPSKKVSWALRHYPLVSQVPYLEKIEIDKTDWKSFQKKINRLEGKYTRYEQKSGKILVLATTKVGGVEIRHAARKSVLLAALRNTAYTQRPVHMSKNWKEPIKAEKQKSKWMPVDSARYGIEECIEILKKNPDVVFYERDTLVFGQAPIRTIIATVKRNEALIPLLYSLGAWTRRKGEIRTRGRPLPAAA